MYGDYCVMLQFHMYLHVFTYVKFLCNYTAYVVTYLPILTTKYEPNFQMIDQLTNQMINQTYLGK